MKNLALNKKVIVSFSSKGGDNPNSINPKICFPKSDLPDTILHMCIVFVCHS